MSINYTHPAELLVNTLQRIYDYGMTTTSGGNISIKDEEGNVWITPSGVDKGTLTPADIMKVTPAGEKIGRHTPSCELPFHCAVYRLRPDARVVLHAHSPALVAFSLVGRCPDTAILPGSEKICGKIAFSRYDIPGSISLGEIISAEFANGADSVMMENHGAVVCGRDIDEAFARFETLDYLARIGINMAGMTGKLTPAPIANAPELPEFAPQFASPAECALRESIVKFAARLYRQRLAFTGQLALSAKLADDDFLITPAALDPLRLTSEQVVRVSGGRREAGKSPAELAAVAAEIYAKKDFAQAFIFTRSPHIMAFAASGNALDSRMIPESYIQLRDMPKISYAEWKNSPAAALEKLTPATPVLLIESCGVLAVGKNLTQAFDRLEVADFTANCVLLARQLGEVTPINQAQVEEIIDTFNLPR